jgi:hypothetical protein
MLWLNIKKKIQDKKNPPATFTARGSATTEWI